MKIIISALFTISLLMYTAAGNNSIAADNSKTSDNNKNLVSLELSYGEVIIELLPEKAPNHVERIKTITQKGLYDTVPFYRVIEDFMAQAGKPYGDGKIMSELPNLKFEANDIKHVRGVVSMARAQDRDSAHSQFFIMLADAPHLDGNYTAFGKVISGMEYVDKIKKGNIRNNGIVSKPDKIIKMRLIK